MATTMMTTMKNDDDKNDEVITSTILVTILDVCIIKCMKIWVFMYI